MMKTVIDTSTLISLARISYLELLPKLRKSVVLPHEVYEEAVIKGEEKGIADAIVIKGFIKNYGIEIVGTKSNFIKALRRQTNRNLAKGDEAVLRIRSRRRPHANPATLPPDLKEVKLFNAYNYYYHNSMSPEDLQAAITMKENYIRVEKGRDNRIGHNWEAAVEWFVDKFTVGAAFRQQPHRTPKMDSRRITLHLVKSVGKRRQNAEVDHVWTVTSGLFSPVITNVLECKSGLIRKRDIDDFFDVLRYSTDFGVDTPQGRHLKQGVTGVFAGSAFNPREKVTVAGRTISLASYANRQNIQLLKASDFNEQLRKRGCDPNVTIQSICKATKDENEVRETLDAIWLKPADADRILHSILQRNEELYRFERTLKEEPAPTRHSNP